MPLNERRRNFKIVDNENKSENELIGGIKNALERGENPEKTKQSFLNAGYKKQEIEKAINHVMQISPQSLPQKEEVQQPKPSPTPAQTQTNQPPTPTQQNNQTQQIPQQPQKKFSKLWIIVMIVLAIVVIGGAALLALFWDKL